MKKNDERVYTVETRITAKTAYEISMIFFRFNALFVRPCIRGAIRKYQTQLIQRVKDDIETLDEKIKVQYMQSHEKDLPFVSSSIIWAKQNDRQLTTYIRRVENVLGKWWPNHVKGQELIRDGYPFRVKRNTQEVLDDWVCKVQQRNHGVSRRIFAIDILNKIQKIVDDLPLHNLHAWVARLDETVEQQPAGRFEASIKAWTCVLEGLEGVEATDQNRYMDTDAPATHAHAFKY